MTRQEIGTPILFFLFFSNLHNFSEEKGPAVVYIGGDSKLQHRDGEKLLSDER